MDWKLFIEVATILTTGILTVSAIYWRLHYHQKETSNKITDHACTLKTHAEKLEKLENQNQEIQNIKPNMKCWMKELELKIEAKLSDRDNKSIRRLQRIEKILIRMDERLKTHATDELKKEVV